MEDWKEETLQRIKSKFDIEFDKIDPLYILKEHIRLYFQENYNQYYKNESYIYETINSKELSEGDKFLKTFARIGNFMGSTLRKELFPIEYFDLFLNANIRLIKTYNLNIAPKQYSDFLSETGIYKCTNWLLHVMKGGDKYCIGELSLNKAIDQFFLRKGVKSNSFLGMVYPQIELDGYSGDDRINILFNGVILK